MLYIKWFRYIKDFLLLSIISYIFITLINFFINYVDFYDKKEIKNYYELIKDFSLINNINSLPSDSYIIFIIDKFDKKNNEDWHGEMVYSLLSNSLNENNKKYFIIKMNLLNSFNESSILLNKKNIIINNYLFISRFKELFPNFKYGINESFVYPNPLSDIFLLKQFNDLKIKTSIAAGNFKEASSISSFFNQQILKFYSIIKETLFFNFFYKLFNYHYIKFNINKLFDNHSLYISNKPLSINEIYYSSEKSMENNFLYFAKKFPNFFLISNNLSSSAATPIGLVNMLLKH